MAYNELIDGNLSVGGTQTQTGAVTYAGTVTASGQLSLGGAVVSNLTLTTTTVPTSSTASAATINAKAGIVVTENLSTATQAIYSMAITNSAISAGDLVFASVTNGTNTGGLPALGGMTATNGKLTIAVINGAVTAGTGALNGSLRIGFFAFK